MAGRLESWQRGTGGGVEVLFRLRGGERQRLRCARILLCTGPSGSRAWSASPPVPRLMEQGMPQPDGQGLSVLPDGKALNTQAQAVPGLVVLGPLARDALWEITAVPEIRAQAMKMAEAVLAPL
ncbi:FAD/NAD(P)-binding protein [Teichococcus aestuarii]|uniref:FAD/NAD(P)-binding domain-containing protein n=1 Tax=Teichococcus aestuarii TaxID=568898 RepID=A0A2U1UXT9_9PROT|nr:hypothetical protein [Pseudoroseomonas aestuarii]PWC26401.1 hypothetical protein CR165_23345 [Pseudoroseomonas aestuarii]